MSAINDGRRKVLEMLAAGTVSVDDAERLLLAVGAGDDQTALTTSTVTGPRPTPKYLRVVIREPGRGPEDTPNVNIRVPLQLVRAGVKLGAVLPPEALHKMDAALEEKGVQLDLRNLTPETLDEFIEALGDLTLEVNEDGGQIVRVFCE